MLVVEYPVASSNLRSLLSRPVSDPTFVLVEVSSIASVGTIDSYSYPKMPHKTSSCRMIRQFSVWTCGHRHRSHAYTIQDAGIRHMASSGFALIALKFVLKQFDIGSFPQPLFNLEKGVDYEVNSALNSSNDYSRT